MTLETIRSLLFLTEEDLPKDGPVAVEDLVKYFPSKHMQAIEKLWGSDRLTYKGQQFFSGDSHGPVYDGVMAAAEKAIKTEVVTLECTPAHMPTRRGSHDHNDDLPDFDGEANLGDQPQEVYLGYQPSSGHLFVGYDAWIDDDSLQEAIDKYMDALDKVDGHRRDAVEAYIETELQNDHTFYGVLIELSSTDGKRFTVVEVTTEPDGFYKGVYNAAHGTFKGLKLIDLRLD